MAQLNKVVAPVPAPRHLPRLPSRKEMLITMIVLIVAVALAFGGRIAYSALTSRGNTITPAVPQQPVVVPAKPEVPAVSNPQDTSTQATDQSTQPAQNAPKVVAPVVLNYQVVWTEVKDFDPFTIPVEKGLFSGTNAKVIAEDTGNAIGETESPEGRAYAIKVYPELLKPTLGMLTAIARDPVDKDVVLMGVFASYDDRQPDTNAFFTARIALTINGGKSWCNLNLLPVAYGDSHDVRVLADSNSIHLFAEEPRPGSHWRETTVKRNDLPCS